MQPQSNLILACIAYWQAREISRISGGECYQLSSLNSANGFLDNPRDPYLISLFSLIWIEISNKRFRELSVVSFIADPKTGRRARRYPTRWG